MNILKLATIVIFVAIPAIVHSKTVTIRGPLLVGSSDSGIEGLGQDCNFLTDSKIGSTIFTQCQHLDECEITGSINSKGTLTSVQKVRKIDTNFEPANETILDAACWISSIESERQTCKAYPASILLQNVKAKHLNTNGANLWLYTFDVHFKESPNAPSDYIGRHSVQISKQGDKWALFKTVH